VEILQCFTFIPPILCKAARRLDTTLEVNGPETWPIVRLKYGAPIKVDADYKDLLVIQKCISGHGTLRQGSRQAVPKFRGEP
jgi:hypothetical protein